MSNQKGSAEMELTQSITPRINKALTLDFEGKTHVSIFCHVVNGRHQEAYLSYLECICSISQILANYDTRPTFVSLQNESRALKPEHVGKLFSLFQQCKAAYCLFDESRR